MFWHSVTDALFIIHQDYICLFSFFPFLLQDSSPESREEKDPKPIDQKYDSSLHRDTRKTL